MEAIWVGVTDQRPLGEVPAGEVVISYGGFEPLIARVTGAVFAAARDGGLRRFSVMDPATGEWVRRGQRRAASPCRLAVKARVLRVHDVPKEEPAPAAEPARPCAFVGCDETFRSPLARKRYCSNSCRAKATRARKNDTGNPRACAWPECSGVLGPQAQKYCSPGCSSKAARAAQLEAAVPSVPVVEAAPGVKLCERDGCERPAVNRYCSRECYLVQKRASRPRIEPTLAIDLHKPQPEVTAPSVVGIELTEWHVWSGDRSAWATRREAVAHVRGRLGPNVEIGPGAIKVTRVMRPPERGKDGLYRFPGGAEGDEFGNVKRAG